MTPKDASRLIDEAGGAAEFGRKLGLDKTPGEWLRRVCNWKTRGIPYRILHEHREAIQKLRRKRT